MYDKYGYNLNYDPWYFRSDLSASNRYEALNRLAANILSHPIIREAKVFLLHGTLMGWWWHRNILPWDEDIDVAVTPEVCSHLLKHRYELSSERHWELLNSSPSSAG